jgi:5-methylthioribose kinase
LGFFFSAEGPQDKNTFDKMIQKLAEVIFSLSSTCRDEVQGLWRQCKKLKVNSFVPDQAKKEKGLDIPY